MRLRAATQSSRRLMRGRAQGKPGTCSGMLERRRCRGGLFCLLQTRFPPSSTGNLQVGGKDHFALQTDHSHGSHVTQNVHSKGGAATRSNAICSSCVGARASCKRHSEISMHLRVVVARVAANAREWRASAARCHGPSGSRPAGCLRRGRANYCSMDDTLP